MALLMLTGVVRGLAGLLSEYRRDWVRGLLAETDDLPSRSARLAWVGGGLWLVVREVVMNGIIQRLAFAAGAVGLVWIAWPGMSTNSATPVNRCTWWAPSRCWPACRCWCAATLARSAQAGRLVWLGWAGTRWCSR